MDALFYWDSVRTHCVSLKQPGCGNECHVKWIGKRKHAVMKECIQAKGCDGGRTEGEMRWHAWVCFYWECGREVYVFSLIKVALSMNTVHSGVPFLFLNITCILKTYWICSINHKLKKAWKVACFNHIKYECICESFDLTLLPNWM